MSRRSREAARRGGRERGTLTIIGTSFNLPFGPVADGMIFNATLSGTLADGSPIDTNLFKSAGSDVCSLAAAPCSGCSTAGARRVEGREKLARKT